MAVISGDGLEQQDAVANTLFVWDITNRKKLKYDKYKVEEIQYKDKDKNIMDLKKDEGFLL